MSKHPFEHFNLDENLIEAVKNLNFEKPTEIQNRIIPRILKRNKFNRTISNWNWKVTRFSFTINSTYRK